MNDRSTNDQMNGKVAARCIRRVQCEPLLLHVPVDLPVDQRGTANACNVHVIGDKRDEHHIAGTLRQNGRLQT